MNHCNSSMEEVLNFICDFGNRRELQAFSSWLFLPAAAAAAAKSLQSCLTLCDPIDGSPSGSPVPGILQARTLAWVAISFSNAWKWKVKVMSLNQVWLLATPWTAAHQAPPFMGFSRQEYCSGVPLPSPSIQENTVQLTSKEIHPQKLLLGTWNTMSLLLT